MPIYAGKNLTTTTYWFYIDALYFCNNPHHDIKNELRRYEKLNHHDFDEMKDLEFIVKSRKLVSEEKMGTLNLHDIRSTSIDEVISLWEENLMKIHEENNEGVEGIISR